MATFFADNRQVFRSHMALLRKELGLSAETGAVDVLNAGNQRFGLPATGTLPEQAAALVAWFA